MPDIKCDFKVDYSKIKIFEEYGTKDIKFPIVISVPHAGTVFPQECLPFIDVNIQNLRSNEDLFVNELVLPLANCGIPVISMNIARSFIDVNRDMGALRARSGRILLKRFGG